MEFDQQIQFQDTQFVQTNQNPSLHGEANAGMEMDLNFISTRATMQLIILSDKIQLQNPY